MNTVIIKQWAGIGAITFAVFMAVLDVQIVNTCLHDIAASLETSPQKASWLMTSYLTAEVISIPLIAVLLKRFGFRDTLLGIIFLFTLF